VLFDRLRFDARVGTADEPSCSVVEKGAAGVIAYTIVSRAYVPHARVLARSYTRNNPGLELWALLIDDLAESIDEEDEPFRVLRLADLNIEMREIHRMAMLFGGRLIAAIKPWVFEYFLQQGADSVVYIDSDFVIYHSLEELDEAARTHGVLVVPHILRPMPRDGRKPDETMVLGVGTFNAGMFGVGAHHEGFLEFLKVRLRRECRTDIEAMRVNEQRWLDFVPPLFPHYVVRDPGIDVAPWNIHERPLTKIGDRVLAGGVPLRAFHFSGFDPRMAAVLSARDYWVRPRVDIAEQPVLREVVDDYRRCLLDAGFESFQGTPFAFDSLSDGSPIPASLRKLYADALEAADQSDGTEPPDPYDAAEAPAFEDWYRASYFAAGRKVPWALDRSRGVASRPLVSVGGGMTLGDAGRRVPPDVIESDAGRVGFAGFCPRLLLDSGLYRFVVDAARSDRAVALDEAAWDNGIVVDLAIDGQVLACHEMIGSKGEPFSFQAEIPESLRAPSLSAGVDVRFFTHGGVRVAIEDVLMERVEPASGPPHRVNWLIEMLPANGRRSAGATIQQESEEQGLIATGPHWRLGPGHYRADLHVRAEADSDDENTVVGYLEILADGYPVVATQLQARDTKTGVMALEFDLAQPGGVEFRLRGESGTAFVVGPLFVEKVGSPAATSGERLTDWLPALWLSESGQRIGPALFSVPERPGVMSVGPHWRIDRGRYLLVAEVVAGAARTPSGSTLGRIEALVDGFVAASVAIESDSRSAGRGEDLVRTCRLEFDVGADDGADVELRTTTTGVLPLQIRSLNVYPAASLRAGGA
jgi:hypothetical protein